MSKTKISEYSATANSNTDVASINIDEGCAPSGINNAIRAVMGHLKDFQAGTNGDSFNGPHNGTVGATTPASAAVTTLAASGAVTLSGGTANGVAYLNGSKVLTSGSALTFDGTTLSNTNAIKSIIEGAGINATNSGLVSQRSTNDSQLYIGYRTTPDAWVIGATYTSTGAYKPIAFAVNDAEQMRLTSTGLGIGTSSPSVPLHVSKGAAGDEVARFTNAGGFGLRIIPQIGGSGSVTALRVAGGESMSFETNSTERMRIDSSGLVTMYENVGIGEAASNSYGLYLGSEITSGVNQYGVGAISTLAGTSWSAAVLTGMPLKASTAYTSIAGVRAINPTTATGATASYLYGVKVEDQTLGTNNYGIASDVSSGTNKWNIYASGTANNYFAGNVGIGTSSPSQKLSIQGAGFVGASFNGQVIGDVGAERIRIGYKDGTPNTGLVPAQIITNAAILQFASRDTATGEITFATGTGIPERMRIDSSGALLMGTTSFAAGQNSKSIEPAVMLSSRSTTGGDGHIVFYNPNGAVGQIYTNGSGTVFATSSDYRLKENIAPMTGALDVVQQLNPVTYTWKVDGANGQGFIAHELQAIVPDCVMGEKDAVDADGNPIYQGIDTSFLVATLTAAIQEQQAIIESLKARLDAANI